MPVFAKQISLFDPLGQIAQMKNAAPGAIEPGSGLPYLFGGDKLARDVFGRIIAGARIVLIIAPLATMLALSVGISLGLPAGYFGKRVDAVLSFLANLVLAFPIILLFYLLVSPGILETAIPYSLAGVFFTVSIVLFSVLFVSGYRARPTQLAIRLALAFLAGAWLFATFVFNADPFGVLKVSPARSTSSSPSRSRRDPAFSASCAAYAGHQDARICARRPDPRREPVVHHAVGDPAQRPGSADRRCLPAYRLHHQLLGALGYFGLGMPPESPDWDTMIKEASPFMRIFTHPALAMMSFVLGLNLLADAIREQSLRD